LKSLKYISFKYGYGKTTKKLKFILNDLPKPIVFTNGIFDILHVGHIKYLNNSKNFGSSLIVGINSNISTKLLNKGDDRPINDEIERAEVISSLKSVDLCIIFNDATPENLIKIIHPDIYTKGQDYNKNTITYISTLEKLSITTYFIPLVIGKSSTKIIDKIKSIDK
jgi:rfaE bifunctional protein nucleotidyltransferase chain/domain